MEPEKVRGPLKRAGGQLALTLSLGSQLTVSTSKAPRSGMGANDGFSGLAPGTTLIRTSLLTLYSIRTELSRPAAITRDAVKRTGMPCGITWNRDGALPANVQP